MPAVMQRFVFGACLILSVGTLLAAEVRVAVASNFLQPINQIAKVYQQQTGVAVVVSAGSTGKLYAQIVNGAPFDVFLAAGSREVERLEQQGDAIAGSRFTYAIGKLVIWDAQGQFTQQSLEAILKTAPFKRVSLANPLTAPYGAAAIQVLQQLGVHAAIKPKLIQAENVTQAYQYVATGAADLGFIALSQVKANTALPGHYWLVDEKLYTPIWQQAVLLKNAPDKIQAQAFLDFLKSNQGKALIERFGYGLP